MEGLCRVLGSGVDVQLAGRLFWLRPLTLGRLAACEQHLLAGGKTPLESVLEDLPRLARVVPRQQLEPILRRAYRDTWGDRFANKVPGEKLLAWLDTPDGVLFSTWLCLRTQLHRRIARGRVVRVLAGSSDREVRELRRRRQMVSSLDLLATLDWHLAPDEIPPPPGRRRPQTKRTPIPWRATVRGFNEARYMAPSDVAKLTLYQLKMLHCPPEELGGVAELSAAEAAHIKAKRQDEKAAHERRLDDLILSIFGPDEGEVGRG